MVMGEVVAAVRELVRDLVAELVGRLISWALEAVATLGLATPVIVAQATTAISRMCSRIADLVRKLVKTISNVAPRIRAVVDKLGEIMRKLGRLGRRGDVPGGPDAPSVPVAHGGDGVTSPSGSTSPSGTTAPSGTTSPSGTTTPSGATSPSDTPDATPDTSAGNPSSSPANSGTKPSDSSPPPNDPEAASCSADRPFCADDPIDVATGDVVLSQTDVVLPGLLPLLITRHHQSRYRSGALFGPSWSSTLDQHVSVGPTHVWLATEDGRLLRYAKPASAEPVLPDFGPRLALRRDGDSYLVDDPRRGTTAEFRAVGGAARLPLVAVRRHAGGELAVEHDARGLPTRVRHSGGYEVAVDTDNGRITGLHLVSAAQPVTLTRYAYDETDQLAEVVNSSGLPLRLTHDADGRLTSWTDRNGVWYRYVYDDRGRAVTTIGSSGALNGTFRYQDRRTTHTDTLGHTTTYDLDERGRVVRVTNPLGAVTTREWGEREQLLAVTDPLGRTTRYAHDDDGNVTTVTRPDGSTLTAAYTTGGRDTRVTDPAGGTWLRDHDALGNLIAETDPTGATTRFAYDERGHLAATTNPLGAVTRYRTDAAGLITELTDPLGATTRFERDAFGRVTAETDPLGGVTRTTWTVEGRITSRTRPAGGVERWVHDGEGNVVEHVDELGQVTRTRYTHFDLPSARTAPDGTTTTYAYDTELRLTEVVGPHGLSWRFERDAAGEVVRETDFDGRVTRYAHDAAGRLAARVNGLGETITYDRDVHGGIVAKHTPSGTSEFDRDPCGRVVRAAGPDAEVLLERDARGRVVAETCAGRTTRSEYDAAGRRVRRTTAGGVATGWDYDAAGNPVALRADGAALTFRHDALGRQVRRELGRLSVLRSYSPDSRLTDQLVTAGAPLSRRGWRHRADGNVDGVLDPSGGRALTLDRRGRVLAVRGPGWDERYEYDAVGNITDASPSGPDDPTAGPRAHEANRLRAAGRTTYDHDAQGRVVRRRTRTLSGAVLVWTFGWDAEDRLTTASTPDGGRWRYHYDPMGRRVAKERLDPRGRPVERVDFSWDGTLLAEHTGSDGTSSAWEYEPGTTTPVAQLDRAGLDRRFYAVVADLVGTPTELVDADGAVVWRRTATLWGRTLAQSGPASCPLRFPGQYHDAETGWHYNHLRHYDPDTGRYASQDPLGLIPSINPGAYVPNPIRFIDPLGLQGCGVSGDEAKQQALADAGVPPGSEPLESRVTPSTTPGGRQVMQDHQPVFFPEEVYLNNRDELIVFQDHHTGHQFGEGGVGDQPPHVHVRPYDNPRNGQVPGAEEHYYYDPSLGRPTPAG
ncbi:RHS repeat-associated core domain-containing protein [Actinosynnema pretiosum]|nr:RHS repeat-associated core domain-containing protein [Actinosynnema pretiosum]